MNHSLARMITYIYEFCGPGVLQRLYFGGIPADFDKQAAALALFNTAQRFLNDEGYDSEGRYLD